MNNEQNPSGPAAVLYMFAPLAVYIVISEVCGGCMQTVWILFLQDRAVEAGGPEYAYEALSIWSVLCMILPCGLGCLAIRRVLLTEISTFTRRAAADGAKALSAGAMAVMLTGTVSLSLGINVLISCLGINASLPAALPGFSGIMIQAAVYGLFMPFVEELIFRGLLYFRLCRMTGRVPAAAVSAAVFGLYHAGPAQGLYAFFMGIVFAAAYEKTGRFAVPWALHGVCNLMVLLLFWTNTYSLLCAPAWGLALFGISAGAFRTLRKIGTTDARQ